MAMMSLPVNVRDLMRAGTNLTAERDKTVRIVVAVELNADDALLVALEDVLKPRTARTTCDIGVVGETAPRLVPGTDAVIGVLGEGGPVISAYLREARTLDIRVVTITLADTAAGLPAAVGQPLDDFLYGSDAETLVRDDLGRWLADKLPEKRLALAAGFDFLRSSVSNEYVKATAWQNALIGGVTIIPGADMPVMTANQAKMVLQIAAAYGQRLDTERAKELLAVVGGGFAFRTIARQLLDFVPGFGWALKAGIGYTGTIAMGKAAIRYFEDGADIGRVLAELRTGAREVGERLQAARRASTVSAPGLPAADVEVPYKVEASHGDVTGG